MILFLDVQFIMRSEVDIIVFLGVPKGLCLYSLGMRTRGAWCFSSESYSPINDTC